MLHHIADRPRLLGDLPRVLRPGGWLLVSTTHPTAGWRKFGGSYYAEDWVDLPLAGFMLERLIEPRPTPGLRELDETAYNKLHQTPCFLAVRLLRP
ncbi:hypothetical protein ACFRKB_20775 [Streptomyces scopuliridis]|uniref:hypothetical protein n=1 Tax=Streptomyces scopuliridis TaxID=452529 RepID=UPI0036C7D536